MIRVRDRVRVRVRVGFNFSNRVRNRFNLSLRINSVCPPVEFYSLTVEVQTTISDQGASSYITFQWGMYDRIGLKCMTA